MVPPVVTMVRCCMWIAEGGDRPILTAAAAQRLSRSARDFPPCTRGLRGVLPRVTSATHFCVARASSPAGMVCKRANGAAIARYVPYRGRQVATGHARPSVALRQGRRSHRTDSAHCCKGGRCRAMVRSTLSTRLSYAAHWISTGLCRVLPPTRRQATLGGGLLHGGRSALRPRVRGSSIHVRHSG